MLLSALSALSFFNFALVESAVGRWSLCYGSPAPDVFRAPNGEIPAYTERYHRFGTCPSLSITIATIVMPDSLGMGLLPYYGLSPLSLLEFYAMFFHISKNRVFLLKFPLKKIAGFFIFLSRKYDSSKTGDDYKWVNYGKYLSKLETCKPVYYKNRYDTQVCYLPGVRVKNTQGNWVYRNLLGVGIPGKRMERTPAAHMIYLNHGPTKMLKCCVLQTLHV